MTKTWFVACVWESIFNQKQYEKIVETKLHIRNDRLILNVNFCKDHRTRQGQRESGYALHFIVNGAISKKGSEQWQNQFNRLKRSVRAFMSFTCFGGANAWKNAALWSRCTTCYWRTSWKWNGVWLCTFSVRYEHLKSNAWSHFHLLFVYPYFTSVDFSHLFGSLAIWPESDAKSAYAWISAKRDDFMFAQIIFTFLNLVA